MPRPRLPVVGCVVHAASQEDELLRVGRREH
jgi:hypothetical protein